MCTCWQNCIHIAGAQTTFPGATTTFEVHNHVGYTNMSLGNMKQGYFDQPGYCDHTQIL